MRHYRRQNSGSERVKKVMFRILFVLIAAAVITFGTIILGNYLQRKVDEAENTLESAENIDDPEHEDNIDAESGDFYYSPTVFGATVTLTDYTGEDEVVLAVNELSASYDTVIIPVTTSDGVLLYQSPALSELSRMPVSEDDPDFRLFSSAAAAVKAKNMRLCVMITVSLPESSAVIDGTLIRELSLNGADEVLIALSDNAAEISSSDAEMLGEYIMDCRDISGDICPIGILLSSEIYLGTDSAKQVQQIASAASFLAIDFPTDDDSIPSSAYRYVSRSVTALLGSFNVYNMRVILDSAPELLAAMYQACSDSGISNICFASYVQPDKLSYREYSSDVSDDTSETPQTVDPDAYTNPYATTSKDETDETDETNESVETEETAETVSGDIMWY